MISSVLSLHTRFLAHTFACQSFSFWAIVDRSFIQQHLVGGLSHDIHAYHQGFPPSHVMISSSYRSSALQGTKICSQLAAMQQTASLPWKFWTSWAHLEPCRFKRFPVPSKGWIGQWLMWLMERPKGVEIHSSKMLKAYDLMFCFMFIPHPPAEIVS